MRSSVRHQLGLLQTSKLIRSYQVLGYNNLKSCGNANVWDAKLRSMATSAGSQSLVPKDQQSTLIKLNLKGHLLRHVRFLDKARRHHSYLQMVSRHREGLPTLQADWFRWGVLIRNNKASLCITGNSTCCTCKNNVFAAQMMSMLNKRLPQLQGNLIECTRPG